MGKGKWRIVQYRKQQSAALAPENKFSDALDRQEENAAEQVVEPSPSNAAPGRATLQLRNSGIMELCSSACIIVLQYMYPHKIQTGQGNPHLQDTSNLF